MCSPDFDSDMDSCDVSDIDDISGADDISDSDDVEFLDPSDAESEFIDEVDSDDVYVATKMSDDEVLRIEEMWNDTEGVSEDIEPYEATRMSEDEISRIDAMYNGTKDVEPYRATRNSMDIDVVDTDVAEVAASESLEEKFAAEMDALPDDELDTVQAHINVQNQMTEMGILAEYEAQEKEQYDKELFAKLTDDMPRETLEYMREGLAKGDPAVYEYFGLSSDESSGADEMTLSRRR